MRRARGTRLSTRDLTSQVETMQRRYYAARQAFRFTRDAFAHWERALEEAMLQRAPDAVLDHLALASRNAWSRKRYAGALMREARLLLHAGCETIRQRRSARDRRRAEQAESPYKLELVREERRA